MHASPDATSLLLQATSGSFQATDRLLGLVYDELRERAVRLLRAEHPDHTLQATELVHEAYLRLVDRTRCQWTDRAHFLAVASRAMRRILVDHARRRGAAKRGGGLKPISLDAALVIGAAEADSVLLSLEEALGKLAEHHPEAARIVEMRFFGGLSYDECACVLAMSPRSAFRRWEFAQAWLYRQLSSDASPT